jgi:WD40 repeat protein
MSVEVKKKFAVRSERVKAVDLHPSEPWLLCALYSGQLLIYNYTTEQIVRQWDVCALPLRCAKFIARKQWLVVGADDMTLRVYNYNNGELVKRFEAHQDYLRAIAVHPTLPFGAHLTVTYRIGNYAHVSCVQCCRARTTCRLSCGTGTRTGPWCASLRATRTMSWASLSTLRHAPSLRP